jgi:NADH-quinone oxidoreductase subunit E
MSAQPETQPQFSAARLQEIRTLIAKYPQPRSALLPVLHMAQEDFGYLSMEVQQMVAEVLDVRLMHVREVVTFYTMFREEPCGRHLLEVCTNASCMLNGSGALVRHLCDSLGIRLGETTPDGLFTVTEVECLGACGGAPVVQVDGLYHEKVDTAHLDEVIRQGREGGTA